MYIKHHYKAMTLIKDHYFMINLVNNSLHKRTTTKYPQANIYKINENDSLILNDL